jgi:hypothetical protein
MRAISSLLLAAAASAAAAHDSYALCDDVTNPLCHAAEPAWIKKYSVAAPGT